MAKFPTYEEMGKKVAEKALDEFLYDGKSIREWMQIIASEDAISRKAVMEICNEEWDSDLIVERIGQLPSVSSSQKPKSEWQQDHEILKAYSDGANDVLDHVRAEIDAARFIDKDTKLCKNANASGLEVAMDIIDKFMAESEEKNEVSVSDKSNP